MHFFNRLENLQGFLYEAFDVDSVYVQPLQFVKVEVFEQIGVIDSKPDERIGVLFACSVRTVTTLGVVIRRKVRDPLHAKGLSIPKVSKVVFSVVVVSFEGLEVVEGSTEGVVDGDILPEEMFDRCVVKTTATCDADDVVFRTEGQDVVQQLTWKVNFR